MCRCFQCQSPIICDDDEARICIGCGGRNRRATTVEPASAITDAILTVLAVLCVVALAVVAVFV